MAEGRRKGQEVGVSNSDPRIIKLMIQWFKKVWKVDNKRFTLRVGINKIHENRIEEVEEYWSRITRIPRSQFIKTTLIKAKNKKAYKNFPIHYGTLTLRIKKPTALHHQIIGLIDGIGKMAA